MKPVSQTKDFCTCFYGYTLPMYSIFGNVYGTLYYCTDFLKPVQDRCNRTIYKIHVFCQSKKDPRRGYWTITDTATHKNGGAIFVRIRDFMKTPEFIAENPVRCEHRVFKAQQLEVAAERAERELAKKRILRDRELLADAPRMKRPQGATGTYLPTYSQGAVDGKGYNLKYEENWHELSPCYVGDDPTVNSQLHRKDKPFFENGQNTSGEIAFIVKRDGMKTSFKNYRPEDNRPKVTGYVPKDGTLQSARIEKILAGDIEELRYYVVNAQKINSKVRKMVEEKYGSIETFRTLYSC